MYSKTYAATIVMFLTLLASIFGTDLPSQLDEVKIEQALATVTAIVSFFVLLYERYRKGGVTIFGRKS